MFEFLGHFLLWIVNWRLENTLDIEKAIIIAYPHTSWYDGFVVWCVSFIINIRAVMKAETFFSKLIASICGFVKVNRKGKMNQTEIISKYITNYNGSIYVSIAPEGSRSKLDYIKTGFYHIAKSSNIPIVCGILDYKTRTFTFSKPFYIEHTSKEDFFKKIREYYDDKNVTETTCYPENVSPFLNKEN